MKKRALISVYDKSDVLELASFLIKKEFDIISTGGTYKFLRKNDIPVTEVSEVTDFEEILDGRVKTLHPKVLGGILAIRDNKEHMEVIKNKGIAPIDIVVVNLYPFFDKAKENLSFEDKIEFIDIGGPTMIRAAAKNFQDVVVLTEVKDYKKIIMEIEETGGVLYETRKRLAGKVFNLMSAYDGAIANFLLGTDEYEEYLTLSYKKNMDLRYGENPHQDAAYYVATDREGAMKDFVKLNGKELSYNNIKDMDIAWKVVSEFEEVMCCSVKHNTPCAAAIGATLLETYNKTYECDPISIFGGVVAFNKKVDKVTAMELVKIFLEIVIAPGFEDDALAVLSKKKNLRVIEVHITPQNKREIVSVDGGILVQSRDDLLIENLNVVTDKAPSEKDMTDMIFGMKIVKFVKSNAIVVVKDGMAKGIGGGQVNRIWSAIEALGRAKDGVILASDAFFPFKDVVEKASEYNIRAIIQPGGSIRDKESIESCNKLGIPMVFTGIRHFKH